VRIAARRCCSLSAKFKVLGSGDELIDAGFDVIQGIRQRRQLLDGVLLALVGGGPVPHRPYGRRCWFGCALVDGQGGDELFYVQGLVMGQSGVGLAGQVLGGGRAQCPDRFRQVTPLVDRREQRHSQCLVVDGLRAPARVMAGGGDFQCSGGVVGDGGVQDPAPSHQRTRPAQHRIHRRLDGVQLAVLVGDDRATVGDGNCPTVNGASCRYGIGVAATTVSRAPSRRPNSPAVQPWEGSNRIIISTWPRSSGSRVGRVGWSFIAGSTGGWWPAARCDG